ncbi:60S ribosomal protein L18a-like protein [Abrus precatorius]|uniref:60S ribosomal protein L18a-like protein n=1 Tax=Abrus precatorius TaxID=3816 RepID=A0A8B8JFA6_ABRPR|nr:60S ribosomal protein L18a-like protein [Abrus precatorius]XP_027330027.1 60S ribosomal protein L18a-like protein [Abrus precatorius]
MDKDLRVEEAVDLRNKVELVRSASDKHHELLRPSARNYSRGQAIDATGHGKGKYALIRDPEDFPMGIYDKPLPCFGCGIGWFSFLFGFLCPPMWYYATILYFGNHYRKDPRERAGLGASAIAALLCSVALLIIAVILLLKLRSLYF